MRELLSHLDTPAFVNTAKTTDEVSLPEPGAYRLSARAAWTAYRWATRLTTAQIDQPLLLALDRL